MKNFTYKTILKAPKEEVFDFLSNQNAFTRFLPPWQRYTIKQVDPIHKQNATVALWIKKGFFSIYLESKIIDYQKNISFTDQLVKGPFTHWVHQHKLRSIDENTTELIDTIEYQLPPILRIFNHYITKELHRLFSYRSSVITNDLTHIKRFPSKNLKVLLSGSSGFVGSHLKRFLDLSGFEIYQLTRKQTEDPHLIFWDVEKKHVDEKKLTQIDVVIHLAGENIAGYWTRKKKTAIYNSRINSTLFLADIINKYHLAPSLCICASADGIYGFDNHEINTELQHSGSDFLARVCKDWEEASKKIKVKRLINARFSMVLSPQGGALSKIIPVFKLGLGAILGSGRQNISWIYIDDLVYQIHFMIYETSLSGPVNVCSPVYVTNKMFSQSIAKTLKRPLLFRIPSFILSLLLGDLARSLLLCDKKIIPEKLMHTNTIFSYPDLEKCLFFMFGKENIDDMKKKSDV